jgi:hypothetical protein
MAKSAVFPAGARRGMTSTKATMPWSCTLISQRLAPDMTS